MPTALPLVVWVYVLGIGLGDACGVGASAARWAVLFAGLGLLLALGTGRLRGLALLLAALSLGGLAQTRREPVARALIDAAPLSSFHPSDSEQRGDDDEADLPGPRDPLLCRGVVAAPPLHVTDGVIVRVRIDGVAPDERAAPDAARQPVFQALVPSALVAVSVRGALAEPLYPGDRVLLRARLRSPQGLANPGAPDNLRRAAADGVQALASAEPAALVRVDERRFATLRAIDVVAPPGLDRSGTSLPHRLARLVDELRTRLDRVLRRRLLSAQDPTAYALVASLVLGERAALGQADLRRQQMGDPLLDRTFRDAGIYHVLSVSGLHLAVASYLFYSGLCWFLLRLPWLARRLSVRRLAAAAALPATLFYTLLTGAEIATVRAAVVAVLFFLSVACGRRARLSEALAGAVIFLLHPGAAPLSLFDPALQLSLAAALGTSCLRPLQVFFPGCLKASPDLISRVASGALRLLEASLAAILATTPLCALHFAQFQAAGLLGNLIAAPLGELVVVPAGLAGALLGLPWPAAGGVLVSLAGGAALVMAGLAEQVAGLGLSFYVPAPAGVAMALYALALLKLAFGQRGFVLPMCGSLLLYICAWALPPGGLTATFLDVGQGDAATLEPPGGGVIVIDAGGLSDPSYDPGERVVAPYLRRQGHRRIDLLVASHPHPDHVAGMVALLDDFSVGELWTALADGPLGAGTAGQAEKPSKEKPDPSFLLVLAAAARKGVPVNRPRPLQIGGLVIEPLAPCQTVPCLATPYPELGHNDNSLVLRVSYAGRAILFPGDIELPGELLLLEGHDRGLPVAADLLKAPHHCSRTSSSESLLREVAPHLAVCSLGLRNRYGFPPDEIVGRYQQAGVTLLRTDRAGAVQATVGPSGEMIVTTSRAGTALRLPGRAVSWWTAAVYWLGWRLSRWIRL